MGDRSKIEWTDATWNPVTGCTKVSAGCKFCYAEREFPRVYPGRKFTDVRLHPDRLDQPLRWKRPRKIFVVSMGDPFHGLVKWDFILRIFKVMDEARHHTFQLLTKRVEEMLAFCRALGRNPDNKQLIVSQHGALAKPEILPNVWLGFSAEDQKTFDERWQHVRPLAEAWMIWASLEPLLGKIILPEDYLHLARWTVTGGESGRGRNIRPSHPDNFRSLRDQCQAAGVPFFFKQWGEWAPCGPIEPNDDFEGGTAFQAFSGGQIAGCLAERSGHPRYCIVDGQVMERVGKKCAGRLLDGREWNEFPVEEVASGKWLVPCH